MAAIDRYHHEQLSFLAQSGRVMEEQIEHLEELYRLAAIRVAALRRVCTDPTPDIAQLSKARHGLISVSIARSRYLQTVIYPLLGAVSDAALSLAIQDLDSDLATRRALSSRHVTHWSLDAVQADWPGYRKAVARLLRGVETRIVKEKSVILPALHKAVMTRAECRIPA
ncbi:hypothetical protein [Sphingomonas adhaesiva]|uniref:hypothetical protein n=1 Tax=Sphingomonas adhaesiva TaxID=28212 RepID=UPI002FFBBFA4